jgi:anti-sigma regulatory factor (Ser/Thr protein kinase)
MSVERLELRLWNRPEEKQRLRSIFEQIGAKHGWSGAILNEVELVLEEWITNIIDYAYEDDAEHQIKLTVEIHPERLEVQTEDDGKAFNPLNVPPPDLEKPLEERSIGGLGTYMIRKLTDEVQYRREGERNLFWFSKSLGEPKLRGRG